MREPWAGLVPIIASLASACFHPSYDRPACGPGGACPSGLTCSTQNICERPDQLSDGGLDSTTTATPPDARLCFGNAPFAICLAAAPAAPLVLSTTTPFNTDGNMCAATTSGATGYCVLAGSTISFTGSGSWRAIGSKPLVLIAGDSIMVSRTLEAGAGADFATCPAPTTAPASGGGGAGGSFTGVGGAGAASALGGSVGGSAGAAGAAITTLRGGCAGRDGDGPNRGIGGHGGGAVLLIAGNSINITATGWINAAGQGGRTGLQNSSGGGGGGSGGMIVLDAPIVTSTGLLLANGGGGGEGSGVNGAGENGDDPININPAAGGNMITNGGDGGSGSSGVAAGGGGNGLNGTNVSGLPGGGGGGGGSAGLIVAPGNATLGSLISPAPVPQLP